MAVFILTSAGNPRRNDDREVGEGIMAEYVDKGRNYGQEAKGKVQEVAGKPTNDRSLQAKGYGNQASAKSKNFFERIKDVFRH
jgi:uncharacterized protein YjbJ (UPF0337 family)